ncbi:hypothetical protein niasHT_002776 [Heterodera trifolii]|uniref:Uncharacterized protein n=1 Tax=Heterodera trifolii TaxID=157864 RepID=A0ABD2M884_9BILA
MEEKPSINEEKPKPPKLVEKRISLGQIHVPQQRKEIKNETEAAKQINDSRPQTAKAARELMEQNSEVHEVRRRIAAKIKAEVINGK